MPLLHAPGVLLNTAPVVDLVEGLDEVARMGLYEVDDPDSHIKAVIDQVKRHGLYGRDRDVVELWLARDDHGQAVGMALVTQERLIGSVYPVVNLFVRPEWRGRGIGLDLVVQARQHHPQLEGHYTADSVGLYQRLGIHDVGRHRYADPAQRQRAMEQRHRELREAQAVATAPTLVTNDLGVWDPHALPNLPEGRAHRKARRQRGR